LPELDKLIRIAPSRTYDVLICREVDRLARDRFKQLATEIELENHGVLVEYVVGQFENTDEGRLLKGLVSEFAEYERGKIKRRTYNGKLRSVEAGNTLSGGGSAPYGYDEVTVNGKRTLVVNDHEAEIVRVIFDLYGSKLYSIYQVAAYLDERKVPLPAKGNGARKRRQRLTWSPGAICEILAQEVYLGHWYYRKTRTIKDAKAGKPRTIPRPREEWMEVPVPRIISDESFEAVKKRKAANKVQKGHQRKFLYALGGMLECGHCHRGMTGSTKVERGRQFGYYRCNGQINRTVQCDNRLFRVDKVESTVWSWIKSLLMEPAMLHSAMDEYQQQQRERVQPHLSMLESSQARIVELEGQKTRLIEAYSKGILSLDELAVQKTQLDKEISELIHAVLVLRAETEPQLLTTERVEMIEAIAAEICASVNLVDENKQAQREIFQLLDVHVILVHDGAERWADVTCVLGNTNCVVVSPMS
jgi:site-specific DNA recombinase